MYNCFLYHTAVDQKKTTTCFGHGSWLPMLVCSVSKMHVVEQACWVVGSYCRIFSCLLVTTDIYLLAAFKAQIPDCCKDWRADTV